MDSDILTNLSNSRYLFISGSNCAECNRGSLNGEKDSFFQTLRSQGESLGYYKNGGALHQLFSPCCQIVSSSDIIPSEPIYLLTLESDQVSSLRIQGRTIVYWGDGTKTEVNSPSTPEILFHNYPVFGEYMIYITNPLSIKYIQITYNNVSSIDVSPLTNLEYLNIEGNLLSSINLINNTLLTYLNILVIIFRQ
jgi:hypothetical protein